MRLSGTLTSTPTDQTTAPAKTGAAKGTQDAQNTLGDKTVQPTRGKTIGRNIANFFKSIGKPLISLHNRVQAHQAKQKTAANDRAAQTAAKNVLKHLGKDTADVKLASSLPALLAKAAKLDPSNPVGQAVKLLEKAASDVGQGTLLDTTDWKSMAGTINTVIDVGLTRRQATEMVLADDIGFGMKSSVTSNEEIDEAKDGISSLLTELQKKTDAHNNAIARSNAAIQNKQAMTTTLGLIKSAKTLDAKLGHLSDALDLYLTGGVKKGDVFRLNEPVTKAITDLIAEIAPDRQDEIGNTFMTAIRDSDANDVPDKMIDAAGSKLKDGEVTGEHFASVLDVAHKMMTEMIGGTNPDDVEAAANRVPDDVVRVLKLIDQKANEHFPNDDVIAANAFIGTIFLRFEVPAVNTAAKAESENVKYEAVGKMAGAVTLTTFNAAAAGQADKTSRFKPEVGNAYGQFVATYKGSVDLFRSTVLGRDVD
jgi:hypothetical protein